MKKLMIIPAVLLAIALAFTACNTAGDWENTVAPPGGVPLVIDGKLSKDYPGSIDDDPEGDVSFEFKSIINVEAFTHVAVVLTSSTDTGWWFGGTMKTSNQKDGGGNYLGDGDYIGSPEKNADGVYLFKLPGKELGFMQFGGGGPNTYRVMAKDISGAFLIDIASFAEDEILTALDSLINWKAFAEDPESFIAWKDNLDKLLNPEEEGPSEGPPSYPVLFNGSWSTITDESEFQGVSVKEVTSNTPFVLFDDKAKVTLKYTGDGLVPGTGTTGGTGDALDATFEPADHNKKITFEFTSGIPVKDFNKFVIEADADELGLNKPESWDGWAFGGSSWSSYIPAVITLLCNDGEKLTKTHTYLSFNGKFEFEFFVLDPDTGRPVGITNKITTILGFEIAFGQKYITEQAFHYPKFGTTDDGGCGCTNSWDTNTTTGCNYFPVETVRTIAKKIYLE